MNRGMARLGRYSVVFARGRWDWNLFSDYPHLMDKPSLSIIILHLRVQHTPPMSSEDEAAT